jgi:hypothetical protein
MNLGASYGSSVLILYSLLSRFRTGKGLYGWLFVPTVGSAFYGGAVTWYSVRFEHSLGWILMQGVGTFVGSTGVLIFESLPISAWFQRHGPAVQNLTKASALTNNDLH